MWTLRICAAAAALFFGTAHATERYTEARISQVETSDNGIILFLSGASGDATPVGNGGSNEPFSKPYLFLANSATDIANRKHLLSTALVALTQGVLVRFRWEDAGADAGRIVVMMVRSS